MSSEGVSKRSIIVAGNCQASVIRQSLLESPELSDEFDIVYFRNFRKKKDLTVLTPEEMQRCAVLIEQIAHDQPELPNKEHVPSDCRIIKFPILWMNSLWPTAIEDPRNKPTPKNPAGPFPYGDRLVLDLLDEGLGPDEIVTRYMATDIAKYLDLERFHQINLNKALILDDRADIKFGAYVLDHFNVERLFYTRNHFTMGMLRYVCDVMFEQLGVRPPKSDLVAVSGGMGHMHIPIHPSIADFFKLEWYDPDADYRYNSENLKITEYIRRYAALE